MSNKSAQKPKNKVTRELDEIMKDFQQTAIKAGQLQYQIRVYQDELGQLNGRLRAINNEAAARKVLDQQKAQQDEQK